MSLPWARARAGVIVSVAALALGSAACSSSHPAAEHSTGGSTPTVSPTPPSSPLPGSTPAAPPHSTPPGAAGGSPEANIDAPAAANGFKIKLHKGLLLKVTVPPSIDTTTQQLTYALEPAVSAALTPVPGRPGYYRGNADGVVTVNVTATPKCNPGSACPQHVLVVGSLTVTVWG